MEKAIMLRLEEEREQSVSENNNRIQNSNYKEVMDFIQ